MNQIHVKEVIPIIVTPPDTCTIERTKDENFIPLNTNNNYKGESEKLFKKRERKKKELVQRKCKFKRCTTIPFYNK